jgi:hypothetical protein
MKKAATNATRYALTESSNVVVDHMQFEGTFINRTIGKFRTNSSLNNAGATFLDFRVDTFPELMKNQYNLVCKFIDEHNHKELIPYISQPLYNVR